LTDIIRIIVACEFVLFREGLKLLIEKEKSFSIIGEASNFEEMDSLIQNLKPDIIIINLSATPDKINSVCKNLYLKYPALPLLLFIDSSVEISIPESIVNGVRGIIWKENSKDELIEAIIKVANGGLFFENPDNCRLNCHLSHKIKKVQESKKTDKILSIREIEILHFIADGLTYKEIANTLFISPRTVETHKNNIMEKLELRNINELIRYALVNNI